MTTIIEMIAQAKRPNANSSELLRGIFEKLFEALKQERPPSAHTTPAAHEEWLFVNWAVYPDPTKYSTQANGSEFAVRAHSAFEGTVLHRILRYIIDDWPLSLIIDNLDIHDSELEILNWLMVQESPCIKQFGLNEKISHTSWKYISSEAAKSYTPKNVQIANGYTVVETLEENGAYYATLTRKVIKDPKSIKIWDLDSIREALYAKHGS